MPDEELIAAYTQGRMTRRMFVRRLVAAGLSVSAAAAFGNALAPAASAAEAKDHPGHPGHPGHRKHHEHHKPPKPPKPHRHDHDDHDGDDDDRPGGHRGRR